jgi:hypothetical protein
MKLMMMMRVGGLFAPFDGVLSAVYGGRIDFFLQPEIGRVCSMYLSYYLFQSVI